MHHFPVASNGKLLDVAVITEEKPQSPESPKVTLHQWVCLLESDSDIEVEDLPPVATPHKGELRKGDWGLPILSGQEGFFCPKYSLGHGEALDPLLDETHWVFHPICHVVIHITCILSGCVCKYKPRSQHIK